jgi:hypothetical protein
MSTQKMSVVANQAPTTLDKLADCELPENVQKQYGERLIKNINAYIEQEQLQQYIENRPKKKQQKTSIADPEQKPILIDVPDSNDEFEDDIDYAAIEIPNTGPAAHTSGMSNPYSNQKMPAKESTTKPKKSSYFEK